MESLTLNGNILFRPKRNEERTEEQFSSDFKTEIHFLTIN